jgi:hypothetical protein
MLFSEQTKGSTYRSLPEHTHRPTTLPWNAGGLSQNKKTKLYLNLVKRDVDVFAIMEVNPHG